MAFGCQFDVKLEEVKSALMKVGPSAIREAWGDIVHSFCTDEEGLRYGALMSFFKHFKNCRLFDFTPENWDKVSPERCVSLLTFHLYN